MCIFYRQIMSVFSPSCYDKFLHIHSFFCYKSCLCYFLERVFSQLSTAEEEKKKKKRKEKKRKERIRTVCLRRKQYNSRQLTVSMVTSTSFFWTFLRYILYFHKWNLYIQMRLVKIKDCKFTFVRKRLVNLFPLLYPSQENPYRQGVSKSNR